jgi:hypothetical protein
MKQLLCLAVSLLLSLGAVAAPAQQTSAREGAPSTFAIQGRVVDEMRGMPLSNAIVVARLVSDTTQAGSAVTRADGSFRIERLRAGQYSVAAIYLGRTVRAPQPVTVSAQAPLASVGDLRVSTVVALEGIQVVAERPPVVQAEDRTIYNVQEMPAVSGGAADVMRTLPELEVDIDGNIKMVGGRGVTIFINGRPSPLSGEALTDFINNLPADRVERVEVIPNPSVRFGGGEAAIVNVVLKRGVQLGLSGSVSLNAATRGGNGVSGQIAFQQGKLTLFGGGSTRLRQMDHSNTELRENLYANPVTFLDQATTMKGSNLFAGGDLTAEYQLSEHGTLWGSTGLFHGGRDSKNDGFYRLLDAEQQPLRIFERRARSDIGGGFVNAATGYRYILEPQRHELSVEARYVTASGDQDGRSVEETLEAMADGSLPAELRLTAGDQSRSTLTAKADYVRPVGRRGRIEAGVEAEREAQDDASRMDIFDSLAGGAAPVQSARADYSTHDDQYSAYLNASQRLGKLSLQGGLRAERSFRELAAVGVDSVFEQDYFSLFPSANAIYDFGQGRSARLSYSKRVRRPRIWDINPFVLDTDPLNRMRGNPELDPSETHSIVADLTWRLQGVTLRFSPNYRRTDGEIERIRSVDASGISTVVPQNLNSVTSYGASLTASGRPIAGSNLSVTLGANRFERDADNLNPIYSGTGSSSFVNTNASMRINEGTSVQASMRVNGPRESPQGRFGSTLYTDFGLRQTLLGDKASLNLRVTDPFDLFRMSFTSRDPSFSSSGSSRSPWGARSLSLSVSYRFGKMPKKKSSETRIEDDAPAEPAPGM